MSMTLEILVPDGVALNTITRGLQATDATGRFGLLPGHENSLTVLEPCVLMYRDENDRERFAAVDGGVLLLERNQVVLVTREVVLADRLEGLADAAEEMLSTRHAVERRAEVEFSELQTSLLRELGKADRRAVKI